MNRDPDAEEGGLASEHSRIERVEAIALQVPLPRVFVGPGYAVTHRTAVITRIHAAGGLVGEALNAVGEIDMLPHVIKVIDEEVAPLLVGRPVLGPEGCWQRMEKVTGRIDRDPRAAIRAISCVDTAIWDAVGKAAGLPLNRLWGGYRQTMPTIANAGYQTGGGIEEFRDEMLELKALGLGGCKFKVGLDPAMDAAKVVAARDAVGPDFVLCADANRGWTRVEAIDFCWRIEGLGLRWLEEPCRWRNAISDDAHVRCVTGLPICAGQSETSGQGWATTVPGRSHVGPLPRLTSDQAELAGRLREHVQAIASRPHNVGHPRELERAALSIEHALASMGYDVHRQPFRADGQEVRNLEVVIEPPASEANAKTLVVGAHYDSYLHAPGANDNGTGVAGVIELARLLADLQGRSSIRIRLVLFVNEEPPYFKTELVGSLLYARRLKASAEPVFGMFSLETLGFYSDEEKSQHYPAPLGLLYPTTGNFVAFVGLTSSRAFVRRTVGSFRALAQFPSVGGTAARDHPRHRLVRSLGVRAGRDSGPHDHGHRAVPVSTLSHHRGQPGQGRLRQARPGGVRPGAGHQGLGKPPSSRK